MIQIDGDRLRIEDVVAVANSGATVAISEAGKEKIEKSHQVLDRLLATNRPVYGINTGFGIFADQRIPRLESDRLSRNLILSHAVGIGNPLPDEVVRAALLVRANTLAKGYSGIRLEVVQTMLDMLNAGVVPVVPEQGSLGSSGDLGPLSHLALVFTTDGEDRPEDSGWARYRGEALTGSEAMERAGLKRIVLGPKEGLALNNGATFCAAIAALAIAEGEYLLRIANKAVALSVEALLGCSAAFDARIHEVRGQQGQIEVARVIREDLEGSGLADRSGRVQDAYSLRCAPQVHGAVADTLKFARNVVEREINAVTDNPILFPPEEAISGGNFHGEPIGLVMDYLGIALAELGGISERRTFRLIDGKLNGELPPMLVDDPETAGLNSGLMMPHYTAASLVLENQTLAHPDSVHSLPTSGEQEDHNANAMTAARHAAQIVENVKSILAIELYTVTRAIDLRLRISKDARLSPGSKKTYDLIRAEVPYRAGDAFWGPEIDRVRGLLDREILE